MVLKIHSLIFKMLKTVAAFFFLKPWRATIQIFSVKMKERKENNTFKTQLIKSDRKDIYKYIYFK